MYKIIQTAKYWAVISIVLSVASVVLLFTWGLNLGLDFTGGSSQELAFTGKAPRPSIEQVSSDVAKLGIADVHVQTAGEKNIVLKMQTITNDQRQKIVDQYKNLGVQEQSFTSIGPVLGDELKTKAIHAVLLVLLVITVFISYVFRQVSKGPVPSWAYGVSTIVALLHDILVVVGIFVVLGHFWNIQIDSLFVTALLTVLGFSVHDTIVMYDRIRERLKHRGKKDFKEIVNESINSTLARSLNTSLTVIIVLLALFFFGGESIRYFILALIVGIVTGTYSSIFIASPLLLLFQKILKR